ncbi:MAG TPA: hypothetical protein VNN25_06530, partial [Thermoanaerobaculia bacterium]|nr:hypothetical protein [Thermoanaerobaculia bacterium]
KGALIFGTGAYTTATKFEIRYDGKFVTYYRDNVQWRSTPAPGLVFFLDSSFDTPGAAADNVYFGALNPANSSPFVARGQCVVSDENVQKIGGVSAYDSDVYSLEGYPTCHLTFKANQTNCFLAIGFSEAPAATQDFTNIKSGFILNSDGTYREVINGVGGGASGTYTTKTVFALTYDGGTILPLVDGVSIDPHGDFTTQNRIYFLDSSFYTPGGGVNTLQFGPGANLKLTDTSQLGSNAATNVGVSTVAGPTDFRVAPPNSQATVTFVNAVGPYTVDADVIVTAQGYLDFKSSTSFSCQCLGDIQNQAEYIASSGHPYGGAILASAAAGVELQTSFMLEKHYSLTRGAADSYNFQVEAGWSPANGGFAKFSVVMFKVEVIKR